MLLMDEDFYDYCLNALRNLLWETTGINILLLRAKTLELERKVGEKKG